MLHKIKNKPKLIICNTDPSTKPGKHWVLFFFHNDTVDFFDSLGNDMEYYGDEFIIFAKTFSSKYQISLIQTQHTKILQYVDNTVFTLHTKYVMVRKWRILLNL